MVKTPSTMLELGTPAPPFTLPDPDGNVVSLSDFADAKALIVAFLSNHCPFVKKIKEEMARFGRDMEEKGVAMVAIGANDVERYPADAPPAMKADAERFGYTFPYLFDATQEVARAYQAACTPEFYLFDGNRELVYRGQFDDARPGNDVAPTGRDLRAAVDAVLAGLPVNPDQRPGIGCNIKWKPGNEPQYFGA